MLNCSLIKLFAQDDNGSVSKRGTLNTIQLVNFWPGGGGRVERSGDRFIIVRRREEISIWIYRTVIEGGQIFPVDMDQDAQGCSAATRTSQAKEEKKLTAVAPELWG